MSEVANREEVFLQSKKKTPKHCCLEVFWKTATTYSPTLHRSTIGVSELNFSVRNGKRWNLTAIMTLIRYLKHIKQASSVQQKVNTNRRESLGQLVRLGFDVTVFTPASYQRHRL